MLNLLFRNHLIGRAIINKLKLIKVEDIELIINTIDLFLENEVLSVKI